MAGVGYFKTMGIPVVKGRDFEQRDQHGSPPVVIVTEEFARQYFPNEDPLGKRIQPGISTFDDEDSPMREIVGVVGDIRNRTSTLNQNPLTTFRKRRCLSRDDHGGQDHKRATQFGFGNDQGSGGDGRGSAVVRREDDARVLVLVCSRTAFQHDAAFDLCGRRVVLTLVGLYGVMSYSVAQRTNEIGIRLALGAQTRDVLLMIVKQGSFLILLGLTIGLAGAFAATRLIESLLFGVTTKDPFTFAAAAVLLALVALLACYIPAWRATKVDPLRALRYE